MIVVDPDNERLASFYARSGFTGTGAGDLRMFVKVATVRAHLRPPSSWASMSVLLGDDLLSTLLGVSPASLHSYRSRERPTPDQVGVRLHFVALVVADLTGSYNDVGVRRWFDRPRAVLDGQTPRAILTGDWSPDDEAVRRVRDLAHTLPGPTLT
ncbi:MAG: hypothetical protein EPN43_01415 [Jatrophihabitans sp.]|nr:MAG: hypothetical protein EPN43_01415 [Jatrophihabitans sp.]